MMKNKAVVATVCVVVSVGAIAGGLYVRSNSAPLALPVNVDEAIAGLKSDAFSRMDDQRRRQYAFEAGKLMRELSEEEREAMREDEDLREAMRAARQDMLDEMVRKMARDEGMELPAFGPRGRGRPNPDEMTDEQREQMQERREQMRERIAEQLKDAWESGDAQSSGLRQEFFRSRAASGGGGGRRGGGG